MRDWTIETALDATKATGGTRLVLALVAGHWTPSTRTAFAGTRRLAALAGCSISTVSRRLARLVAAGDLVIVEIGRGRRATRFALPAVDDALSSGSLAFPSDETLRPRAFPSERNATDVEVDSDSVAFRSTPVAFRSTPVAFPPGRNRGNEVTRYARARAREGRSAPSTSTDASVGPVDVPDLHYADEIERLRVAPLIAGIRDHLTGRAAS